MQIRVITRALGRRSEDQRRRAEPLTFGIPLPRGAVRHDASWICDRSEIVQARVLDRWPDGSVRWALIDLRSDLDGDQELVLTVEDANTPATPRKNSGSPSISLNATNGQVAVDTGAARFVMRAGGTFPFDAVEVAGHASIDRGASGFVITDAKGVSRHAEIRSVEIEERGPLRSVITCKGLVVVDGGRRLNLVGRVHFFAGLATSRVIVTLTNPNRAKHAGGFWDLGDPGSVLIKDASLTFQLPASNEAVELYASPEAGAPWTKFDAPFEIYQDSSGGDRWQSSNHINRERRVPMVLRGYNLRAGSRAQAGLRATPIVALARGAAGVAITTPYFWQNFPKAVDTDGAGLTWRLFPRQYNDLHEIQGGEQKTHELFVSFGPDGVTSVPLAWCQARTIAGAAPDWCLESGAVPFLAQLEPAHATLVNAAVEGPSRFELKRAVIDEYGWRHFGELYGDHEGVKHKGATPLVSHYNNQYDAVAGFSYQFLRTGDPRWWAMMFELAAHVIDIDLYHTSEDKSGYNRGMFWHTYHYGDAEQATHRTFPRAGKGRTHGGGPSAGHNYVTGLMQHYFLTGDAASREAVLQMAQYVIDLDDGHKTIYRWLDRGATGNATLSASGYYGPGRGPANSLSALVDGHRLSGERRFLDKAEELLRRVIHPDEDISLRRLDVPEQRWFYTMFLQSLGKYLHWKVELGETDQMYAYGRASLLHYAKWMAANEHPYLEKPEKLEFPTETWPAQDIRKSDVFYFAALHASGEDRKRFIERARFFSQYSIATLSRMATRTLVRPVVVLLTSGFMEPWFSRHSAAAETVPQSQTFGPPEVFVPQRARAVQRAKWIAGAGFIAGAAVLWRLLAS